MRKSPKKTKSKTATSKVSKKRTSRSRSRFPALEKKFNLRSRQRVLEDFDYVHKLNDKEKQFLNNFLEEEIITNFKHRGKKLNTTKKDRRRCYGNNNSRNRCIMSREEAMGTINYTSDLGPVETVVNELNPEESILFKEQLLEKLLKDPNEKSRANK